jgi:GntR family transcriptional regulator
MSPKPMPLHHQLREKLLNRILRGEWSPGAAMATEHELAAEYGVSRQTIREAIRALRYEGVVEARRGSGTYVREPLQGGPVTLRREEAFTADERGSTWSTRLVRRETRSVGEAEKALEVPMGTPVELTEKLRLRDGRPFCLTYSFCLGTNGNGSGRRLGAPSLGVLTVLATVLHPYEARLLADSTHTAALQLETLERDARGTPVAFHRIVIPNANLRIDLALGHLELGRLGDILDFAHEGPPHRTSD